MAGVAGEYNHLVINVCLVFAVLTFLGDTTDVQFMYHHGANFWPSVIEEHEYYRLLTCTFIHFGISHLFNNMLVLAYIGDNLERALGKVKYLVLYLAAGIGSSAVSAVWSMFKDEYSVSGGASGCNFRCCWGFACYCHKKQRSAGRSQQSAVDVFCGIFHLSWCNKCRD